MDLLTFLFLLFSAQEPKPACGGLLLDAGGRFETPDYPAHYPSAMRCRWLIRTDDPDRRIRLTFRAFRTEPGRDVLTLLDPLVTAHLFFLEFLLVCPNNDVILSQ